MSLLKAIVVVAGLTLTAGSQATACPKGEAKNTEVASVSVDDAAKLHKKGEIIMVDANGDDTRKKLGVVPGAKLLTSYDKFAASELGVKKSDTLVFYCYNKMCSAAPRAAEVARAKGYKSKVMHAGIVGWKKAGHAVQQIGSSPKS